MEHYQSGRPGDRGARRRPPAMPIIRRGCVDRGPDQELLDTRRAPRRGPGTAATSPSTGGFRRAQPAIVSPGHAGRLSSHETLPLLDQFTAEAMEHAENLAATLLHPQRCSQVQPLRRPGLNRRPRAPCPPIAKPARLPSSTTVRAAGIRRPGPTARPPGLLPRRTEYHWPSGAAVERLCRSSEEDMRLICRDRHPGGSDLEAIRRLARVPATSPAPASPSPPARRPSPSPSGESPPNPESAPPSNWPAPPRTALVLPRGPPRRAYAQRLSHDEPRGKARPKA